MNSNKAYACAAIATALLLATQASAEPTNTQCRLEAQLSDGSLLLGVPEIRAVRCNTSYASLDIPLKEIDHITIEDDHERATIAMRNGDRLSVVLNIGEWHQVVGTYDGKHLALYIDGKLTREGKKEIGPVTVDCPIPPLNV